MSRIHFLSSDLATLGIFIAARMRAAQVYSVVWHASESDIANFGIRRWTKVVGGEFE
jgi:hypothetical protein